MLRELPRQTFEVQDGLFRAYAVSLDDIREAANAVNPNLDWLVPALLIYVELGADKAAMARLRRSHLEQITKRRALRRWWADGRMHPVSDATVQEVRSYLRTHKIRTHQMYFADLALWTELLKDFESMFLPALTARALRSSRIVPSFGPKYEM